VRNEKLADGLDCPLSVDEESDDNGGGTEITSDNQCEELECDDDELCESTEDNESRFLSEDLASEWGQFEQWLVSPDGGMVAEKSAKQHVAQVRTVLSSSNMDSTVENLWDKAKLRHFLDRHAVDKKLMPGTIKSYLASIRHFYMHCLTREELTSTQKNKIQSMNNCVTRWMKAYRKESARRGLLKMDSDLQKIISPRQINKFERSPEVLKTIKLIGSALDGSKCHPLTQAEYVSVRDFVITEVVIANASRSGAIANMTASEFESARQVDSQFVVSVSDHKTAHCHGPAKVICSQTLYGWMKAFFEHFRSYICKLTNSSDPHMFLSWNGEKLTSGQVSRCIQSTWNKAGLGKNITCTVVRKTAVSAVHQKRPEIKSHLADLMCHRVGTADKCYRLVEREFTSASAARELSGVLRESTSTLVDSSEKTCLDEEVESGQISLDKDQSGQRSVPLRSSGTELDARQVNVEGTSNGEHVSCRSQHDKMSSVNEISPSFGSHRDNSVFTKQEINILSKVCGNMICRGHIGRDDVQAALVQNPEGISLLKKYSMSQIINRIKYERRKLLLGSNSARN